MCWSGTDRLSISLGCQRQTNNVRGRGWGFTYCSSLILEGGNTTTHETSEEGIRYPCQRLS